MSSSATSHILHRTIHRIAARPTFSAGIRWSSYVGDVRCRARAVWDAGPGPIGARCVGTASSSSSSPSTWNHRDRPPHERLLVLGSGVAGCAAALAAASVPCVVTTTRHHVCVYVSSLVAHEDPPVCVVFSNVTSCYVTSRDVTNRNGIPVTVLHAGSSRDDCNSYWAQGGIIYRNYRLRHDGGGVDNNYLDSDDPTRRLVDTPRSLVDDIRVASGYLPSLARKGDLDEGRYGADRRLAGDGRTFLGARCPASGVTWNEDAAWKLAVEGPSRVRQLLLGREDGGEGERFGCVVPFDRSGGGSGGGDADGDALSLCLEASHAAPRIIHHADCTGKAITTRITRAAAEHPLIEFVGDAVVTDLLFDDHDDDGASSSASSSSTSSDRALVLGARVLDQRTGRLSDHYAVRGVVLASGGLAGIYRHSTNPAGFNALGSSVGLALRLRDRIASSSSIVSDLEYVQFHPTALYLPNEPRFLLTEALRGEGAILRDASGRAFARDHHPRGELAPRDVVARAVFRQTQLSRGNHDGHNAYLDVTHRDPDWLKRRFPSVHDHLITRSPPLDFANEWIPVVPAAHYTCGGV
ncbi:hypothetical protein ACHAXS_001244, partial [Conticribra weissflogii]